MSLTFMTNEEQLCGTAVEGSNLFTCKKHSYGKRLRINGDLNCMLIKLAKLATHHLFASSMTRNRLYGHLLMIWWLRTEGVDEHSKEDNSELEALHMLVCTKVQHSHRSVLRLMQHSALPYAI